MRRRRKSASRQHPCDPMVNVSPRGREGLFRTSELRFQALARSHIEGLAASLGHLLKRRALADGPPWWREQGRSQTWPNLVCIRASSLVALGRATAAVPKRPTKRCGENFLIAIRCHKFELLALIPQASTNYWAHGQRTISSSPARRSRGPGRFFRTVGGRCRVTFALGLMPGSGCVGVLRSFGMSQKHERAIAGRVKSWRGRQ